MAWREDQDPIIQKAKRDWNEAYRRGDKAAMSAAHQAAEAQRMSAGGYSGGANGGARYALSPHEHVDLGNQFRTAVLNNAPVNKLKRIRSDYLTKIQDPRFARYDSAARRQNMDDIIRNRELLDEETDPYMSTYKKVEEERRKNLEAAMRARQLAVEGGVDRLNRGKYEVERLNADALRQAYIRKKMLESNLPEQLSRQGITGGESETNVIRQNLDYLNNVNSLNNEKNKQLMDIDNKIADLKNNGDIDMANLYADDINKKMSTYIQLMQMKANRDREIEKELEDHTREDFINTVTGAYYDNYMAQINKIKNDNDITNDWQIPYLLAARNKKIREMQQETQNDNGYTQLKPSEALQLWKNGLINDNDFYKMTRLRLGGG